jgi:hypothetical protein
VVYRMYVRTITCRTDVYCSRALYTDELEELKLAGGQHNIIACNYHTHTLYQHFISLTLNISMSNSKSHCD